MNTIAFLLYGTRRDYALELTYSVASIVRFLTDEERSAWRIVLITDRGNERPDLPIEHLYFTPAEFGTWTSGGYQHAAKVHALMKAVDHYGGKTALVDTDTCFLAHPSLIFDRIGPGRSVMHAAEAAIGDSADWRPVLVRAAGALERLGVGPATRMFNSGVVGIDASDAALLQEVLPLMHSLHAIEPVFSIEQLSFSAVLAAHTAVVPCADVVSHYWGPVRRFMHAHLDARFPEFRRAHFDALVNSFVMLGYPRKRRRDQLAARAIGWLRGLGPDYRFAVLAFRSALACVKTRPVDADVWARVAADVLAARHFPAAIVEKDFRLARQSGHGRWMSSSTGAAWDAVWARQNASPHDVRPG